MNKTFSILLILFFLVFAGGVYLYLSHQNKPTYKTYIENTKKDLKCEDCNLIMISLSNVSAGHMSLYGYEKKTTPNLDKWANDAIIFNKAFTQTSWTLPVATSIFTSLYPYTHKVTDRYNENFLDEDIRTLPELLRDNGYKTAAFTGGLDYSHQFEHMRGFGKIEEVDDSVFAAHFAGLSFVMDKASNWLLQNQEDKFFLFLHSYDTHCPFDPPDKFKGKFSNIKGKNIAVDIKNCLRGYKNSEDGTYVAYYYKMEGQKKVILSQDDIDYLKGLYDEEILSVDEFVGNFLNKMDEKNLDKTIVVIFAEHGEMFAKHGRFGRAGTIRGTLYDDVLHVPLIIKIPNQDGKTVNGLVQLIDIMPTLLHLLNISNSQEMQGKNLLPLIIHDNPVNKYVFTGTRFGIEVGDFIYRSQSIAESLRSNKWKLIHEVKFLNSESGEFDNIEEETYELYDLENDPEELNNSIKEQLDIAVLLKKELSEWEKETKNFLKTKYKTKLLPEYFIEESRKRGYW